MTYNPTIHHRRSTRLPGYDYSQSGLYFLTVCTAARLCIFGDVIGKDMVRNELGDSVQSVWNELPDHYPGVIPMAFVVMPNHVHGIIHVGAQFIASNNAGRDESRPYTDGTLENRMENSNSHVGAKFIAPSYSITPTPANPFTPQNTVSPVDSNIAPVTLGEIIRGFKARCTHAINLTRQTPGVPIWQRNYHDHIIRDEESYLKITEYIQANPLRWKEDPNYV